MKKVLLTIILSLAALFLFGCTETPSGENGNEASVSGASINGVELSEYAIIYSDEDHDYSKRAAEFIREQVLSRTGIALSVLEEDSAITEYEIVVGETEREISSRLDASTDGMQFAILAEEKQIALEGDCFVVAAAAYFFIDQYVPRDNYSATVPMGVSIHEPIVCEADNYILLIGDGKGIYQTLLHSIMEDTSDYSDGESKFYGYMLPYQGLVRTYSLSETTDSAAAATALSSGIKTLNGYVGQSSDGEDVESLTELAARLGMSTAVMSTEASTGATPSAFSAHTGSRNNSDEILADQAALKDELGTLIRCGYKLYQGADRFHRGHRCRHAGCIGQ